MTAEAPKSPAAAAKPVGGAAAVVSRPSATRVKLIVDEIVVVALTCSALADPAAANPSVWPDTLLTEPAFEPDEPHLRLHMRGLQLDFAHAAAWADLHAHALSAHFTERLFDTEGAAPGALPAAPALTTVPLLAFTTDMPSTTTEAPTSAELKARVREMAELTSVRAGLALVAGGAPPDAPPRRAGMAISLFFRRSG